VRKLYRARVSKSEIPRRLQIGRTPLVAAHSNGEGQVANMAIRKKGTFRENRIQSEAIVDAYGPQEQALDWYYYLENKIRFPFQAQCI
jgi:hypothetical protein